MHYNTFNYHSSSHNITLSLNNITDCYYALALSESDKMFTSSGDRNLRHEIYLDSLGRKKFISLSKAYGDMNNLLTGYSSTDSITHKLFLIFPSSQNTVLGNRNYVGSISIDLYQGKNIHELSYAKTFEIPLDIHVYPYIDFSLNGQRNNSYVNFTFFHDKPYTKTLHLSVNYNSPFNIKMSSENSMFLQNVSNDKIPYSVEIEGTNVNLTKEEKLVYQLNNINYSDNIQIPITLQFPEASNFPAGNYQDVIHYVITAY